MKIKRGVSIAKCRAEILRACILIDPIFEAEGVEQVITSGSEKYKHSAVYSSHYKGDALDLRSNTINTVERKKAVRAKVQRKLGPQFKIILESIGKPYEHYHLQFTPTFESL
jgi:hypothetical protein